MDRSPVDVILAIRQELEQFQRLNRKASKEALREALRETLRDAMLAACKATLHRGFAELRRNAHPAVEHLEQCGLTYTDQSEPVDKTASAIPPRRS